MEKKKEFLLNTACLVLLGAIFYFALRYLAVWLLPFVIGFFAAMLLQKPVAALTRRTKLPRSVWSVLLVAALLSAVFLLLGALISRIAAESAGFPEWVSGLAPEVKRAFGDLEIRLAGLLKGLPDSLESALQQSPEKLITAALGSLAQALTRLSSGILTRLPGILLASLLSVIAACFLTNDYPRISRFVLAQFSEEKQTLLRSAKRLFTENVLKMLRGYGILFLLTFAELLTGFLLLRLEYAALLALLIAILDILPVLGTGTVLLPWAAIRLLLGQSGGALQLVGLYLVITVIRNVLEPRIIGGQVGLPPIVALVSMYLGLKLFGFLGLFALPILVILLVRLQQAGLIRLWKTPEVPEAG